MDNEMDNEPAQRRQRVAAVFDRSADTYDSVGVPWFTPIAQRLVRELAPATGQRALDIGCGRGAALFALADGVGPTGVVTGIDLAPAMIAATRTDVEARGLRQVDLQVMDAAGPDLPAGAYDVVASSLVIFFLPDPAAALDAWRPLLAPGGRLGVSTFGQRDQRWIDLDELFTPYLPPQLLDARTSGRSGPFTSDAGVEKLLTDAGYTDVRTAGAEFPVRFADTEQWRTWSWSHGQRVMWESVPTEERSAVAERAGRLLEGGRDAQGQITLTQQVRFTTAAG